MSKYWKFALNLTLAQHAFHDKADPCARSRRKWVYHILHVRMQTQVPLAHLTRVQRLAFLIIMCLSLIAFSWALYAHHEKSSRSKIANVSKSGIWKHTGKEEPGQIQNTILTWMSWTTASIWGKIGIRLTGHDACCQPVHWRNIQNQCCDWVWSYVVCVSGKKFLRPVQSWDMLKTCPSTQQIFSLSNLLGMRQRTEVRMTWLISCYLPPNIAHPCKKICLSSHCKHESVKLRTCMRVSYWHMHTRRNTSGSARKHCRYMLADLWNHYAKTVGGEFHTVMSKTRPSPFMKTDQETPALNTPRMMLLHAASCTCWWSCARKSRESQKNQSIDEILQAGQAASTSCIPNITMPQVALDFADYAVQIGMLCIVLLVKLYKYACSQLHCGWSFACRHVVDHCW